MSSAIDLKKIVDKFLSLTSKDELWAQALQAITLHMFAGYGKKSFQEFNLDPVLATLLEKIKDTKVTFSKDLAPLIGMSVIDIWYVLKERDIFYPVPNKEDLKAYLENLLLVEKEVKYAWLLGEMAYSLGLDVRLEPLKRDQKFYKQHLSNIDYIYWLTHRIFLGTRYLQRPLPSFGFGSVILELENISKLVIEQESPDLAAEVAICLALANKKDSMDYEYLLSIIIDNLSEDGSVLDPLLEDTEYNLAHSTAAAMIALANLVENS